MTLDWILLEKTLWSGIVALGFAILFNLPKRLLLSMTVIGTLAGFIKFFSLSMHVNVIIASLFAATFVGFASILISRWKHTSPFVISIPAVIPMIPGYFGYQTLLGILNLAMSTKVQTDSFYLFSIMQNGLNMVFVLVSLSIGVSMPWLLLREKGLNKIKLGSDENAI